MAQLIYACRFEIPGKDNLDAVYTSYQNWLTYHYKHRHSITNFQIVLTKTQEINDLPTNHALSTAIYSSDTGRATRVRWRFPDDRDSGLLWSNDIRIGQFEDRCSIEHLIFIDSVEYSVAPARLLLGSPRVVRDICARSPTYVGDMRIEAAPYNLRQDELSYLLTLLSSNLRRLPIVLLSPYARGEPNLIDADQLARNLAGVAVVVRIEDPEVTWDFVDEVGRQLSCFNGGARIYWPGFSKEADPRGHRLFLASRIEQAGPALASRIIERTIFAVAAFRFVPDQRISEVIRAVEIADRQRQINEKKAAGDDFWGDYERDLTRLDEARDQILELEAENANLRANQKILISNFLPPDEPGDIPDDEILSFSSVLEAVQTAVKRHPNIEILPSAIESAKTSPFNRPFDIYEALADLNDIVDAWKKQRSDKGAGGDLLQHLRDRGWGKRSSMHVSDTTRNKYIEYYKFEYQGTKKPFEPHITIGSGDPNSCASVHFIFDQKREKIVIGHIGKHLPNTKT